MTLKFLVSKAHFIGVVQAKILTKISMYYFISLKIAQEKKSIFFEKMDLRMSFLSMNTTSFAKEFFNVANEIPHATVANENKVCDMTHAPKSSS